MLKIENVLRCGMCAVIVLAITGCQSPVSLSSEFASANSQGSRALSSTVLPKETDPAHGWNWRDPGWFTSRGLGFAFAVNSYWGVNQDIDDDCSPEKGWTLYTRRITNADFLASGSGTYPVVDPQLPAQGQRLYFALYNRVTGTLRTFFWFAASDAATQYFSVTAQVEKQGQPVDTMVFDTDNKGITGVASDKANARRTKRFLTGTNGQNAWLVLDTNLAYDTNYYAQADKNYTRLAFYISRNNEQHVTLTGNWSVITGYEQVEVKTGLFDALCGLGQSTQSAYAQGSKNASQYVEEMSSSKIAQIAAFGDFLESVMNQSPLGSPVNLFGVGIAAFGAIPSFMSVLANGGITHIEARPITAKAQLTGTISTVTSDSQPVSIPLPGWLPGPSEMTYFTKASPDERVGLVSFSVPISGTVSIISGWNINQTTVYYTPGATIDLTYGQISQKITVTPDLASNMQLNPYSGLEVVALKYAIEANTRLYSSTDMATSSITTDQVGAFVDASAGSSATAEVVAKSPNVRTTLKVPFWTYVSGWTDPLSVFDGSTKPRLRIYVQLAKIGDPSTTLELVKTLDIVPTK